MRGITSYFSVTKEYEDISDVEFNSGSILLHSMSTEERSKLSSEFKFRHADIHLIYLEEITNQSIKFAFNTTDYVLSLRSKNDSNKLTALLENKAVYLDITGLTHSSWAWILRAALARKTGDLWVIYSEPEEYKFHDAPLEGQIFDLSEKILGIAPLPGFARLRRDERGSFIFMPLLGFEGVRLAHIIESVQPSRQLTFPVFGVPGFKHDYPFHSYHGNRIILEREGIWRNWRYEKASCPESIYVLGKNLLEEYKDILLRIALIGTKPHSLGAVLLKLYNPDKVDLIYDHPVRKVGRTKGRSKTNCYWITPFTEEIKIHG
jgi:hypothetical protein